MDNKTLLPISIIILAMSVVFGSIWIGHSLGKFSTLQTPTSSSILTENIALTLPQVAEYLNLTEEEVRGIIGIEQKVLEETGSFHGKMFPYITINNKQYFHKDEIDEWLKEHSIQRTQYDTIKGWVL